MFTPVPSQIDFVHQEHEVLEFWKRTAAFEKLVAKNRGQEALVVHRRPDHGQ